MPRRLYLIGCAILLLASVALWGLSYLMSYTLTRYVEDGYGTSLSLVPGGLWIGSALPPYEPKRSVVVVANRGADFRPENARFLGFAGSDGLLWRVRIPLYFPTLLSALLTFWVWHRQRVMTTGKGFEVQTPPGG